MKYSTNRLILSAMFMVFLLPFSFSQNEESPKKKVIVITKTIDENGEEKVTKTVKEGDKISEEEMDKMVQDAVKEGREVNVEVDVTEEGKKKIRIIEQDIEMDEDGDEIMMFKGDDGSTTELKDGEIRIIKMKKGDGEEIEIEGLEGDGEMIWIESENEGESGDVIIIEEETTEEMDENGKVVKKTVKKKKKIIKKDGDN